MSRSLRNLFCFIFERTGKFLVHLWCYVFENVWKNSGALGGAFAKELERILAFPSIFSFLKSFKDSSRSCFISERSSKILRDLWCSVFEKLWKSPWELSVRFSGIWKNLRGSLSFISERIWKIFYPFFFVDF